MAESISDALSNLEDRVIAAEGHQYNTGQQMSWLWHEGLIVDAMTVAQSAQDHRQQFGPWMEKRLLETFNHGVHSINLTR